MNRVGGGDEPPSSHTTVRTVRVYGGSIKMGNARLPSVNSLSSYASSHSTLQEVFYGMDKNVVFPSIYPLHLLCITFGMSCKLIQ